MTPSSNALINRHASLTESLNMKVASHTQREEGEWIRHTLMIDAIDVPFVFKRKQAYRSLKGVRVNLTYYPTTQNVAGIEFEVMKVVRLRRS